MYVCMYVCILALPLRSRVFPAKKHGFSSVFAKRTSKNIEFFQIFGKRRQEAQASKKAGRGNRAWDPCFATPAPRRLRLVERHQIAARYVVRNRRRAGGLGGGVILYRLVSIRHAEQCRRIFTQGGSLHSPLQTLPGHMMPPKNNTNTKISKDAKQPGRPS